MTLQGFYELTPIKLRKMTGTVQVFSFILWLCSRYYALKLRQKPIKRIWCFGIIVFGIYVLLIFLEW